LDIILSLLTGEEVTELDLDHEAELCRANGIQFVTFPVMDRGVPSSQRATLKLVRNLNKLLAEGKSLGIHCRQGIGRSAVIVACLLIVSGIDAEAAFQHIGVARGCAVPETAEQREWVMAFARAQQHGPSTFRLA
jgi:protein-tyrosine phosphatase